MFEYFFYVAYLLFLVFGYGVFCTSASLSDQYPKPYTLVFCSPTERKIRRGFVIFYQQKNRQNSIEFYRFLKYCSNGCTNVYYY